MNASRICVICIYCGFILNFFPKLQGFFKAHQMVKSIILITSSVKENLESAQEPRHNPWWASHVEKNVKAPRCLMWSGTMKWILGMCCPSFHISQHKELKLRTSTREAAKKTREDKHARGILKWMKLKITSKGEVLYLTRSRRIRWLNKIARLERKCKLLNLRWKKTPSMHTSKICFYNYILHIVHTIYAMNSE